MRVILGSPSNVYTAVFNSTAKTLAVSGVTGFDMTDTTLQTIWDVTASKFIPCNRTTVALTYSAGLPVWTYTFFDLPSGVDSSDTLVIQIEIPDTCAIYSILQTLAVA